MLSGSEMVNVPEIQLSYNLASLRLVCFAVMSLT